MTAPAVFLDRDGVLNRNVFNPATRAWEAPHHPDDFVLTPGALPALARLAAGGFRLFVVSNQPDYALGKASLEAIAAIHHRLAAQLTAAHVEVDAFYYCYHHPRGIVPGYSGDCACRKPSPYFLFQAHDSYGIELAASWMVGDRASDIACGRAAGVRTIRIAPDHPPAIAEGQTEDGEKPADFAADDIAAAADIILRQALHSSE